mmetsp:Transcript_960/g.1892  ORF Transcript_960/g.1892 Transcript_960/m.1892 type:complete len:335 (+) Transcript_960:5308-6312(+)
MRAVRPPVVALAVAISPDGQDTAVVPAVGAHPPVLEVAVERGREVLPTVEDLVGEVHRRGMLVVMLVAARAPVRELAPLKVVRGGVDLFVRHVRRHEPLVAAEATHPPDRVRPQRDVALVEAARRVEGLLHEVCDQVDRTGLALGHRRQDAEVDEDVVQARRLDELDIEPLNRHIERHRDVVDKKVLKLAVRRPVGAFDVRPVTIHLSAVLRLHISAPLGTLSARRVGAKSVAAVVEILGDLIIVLVGFLDERAAHHLDRVLQTQGDVPVERNHAPEHVSPLGHIAAVEGRALVLRLLGQLLHSTRGRLPAAELPKGVVAIERRILIFAAHVPV